MNRTLNKEVKTLYNEFKALLKAEVYDDTKALKISREIEEIIRRTGAISVLSQKNIIHIIRMQSHLKFMPDHRFYLAFIMADDELSE
jgi:hypothetical protein